MGHVTISLALNPALLGAAYEAGRDGLLDGRPAIGVWVEGRPLPVVIGVRRVNGGGPLQGVVAWRGAVDGVGGIGSRVNIHGVRVALAAPSVGAWPSWGVTGVGAGGGFVGLVHQSVDGVEVLVAAAALRRPALAAGVAARLGAPRGPVAALTLDPAGRHGLLVGTVVQAKLGGLTAFPLRTAGMWK